MPTTHWTLCQTLRNIQLILIFITKDIQNTYRKKKWKIYLQQVISEGWTSIIYRELQKINKKGN